MATPIIITRSAFCKQCFIHNRPVQGNMFIVYGGDSREFLLRHAKSDGICGFTPHLYQIAFPYKKSEGGLITAERVCLMDGCGIRIGNIKPNGRYDIDVCVTNTEQLLESSVEALIRSWRGYTGYTLL